MNTDAIRLRTLVAAVMINVLGACTTLNDTGPDKTWPASKLYKAGKTALDSADYETALEYFETLESRFPFGRYAQQAQLDVIYAYYKFDEPESAIAAADRFIKLYPRHPKVDYAYYMRGLASFNKGMGGLDYFFNLDPTQRDPRSARESFRYFAELVKLFPDSIYRNDALQRMVYLHNNLAKHEIHVADYYMRRGAELAAVNRAKYVIENYQRTPAAIDALVILVKAYRRLELDDLAADALRVLELNAPEHPQLAELKNPAAASSHAADHED